MAVDVLAINQPYIKRIPVGKLLARSGSALVAAVTLALVLIPLLEVVGRRVAGIGISGASGWVQHLTLWLGLLGATLATVRGRHLAIATTEVLKIDRLESPLKFILGIAATAVLLCLTWAGFVLVRSQLGSPETLGGWLPVWIAQLPMPVAFFCMAAATVWKNTANHAQKMVLIAIALTLGPALGLIPEETRSFIATPGVFAIIVLALLGLPLYVVLGGIGLLLFFSADIPIAAIPAEAYRIVTQPVLPSIPLFALAGTVLAAGEAPRKLVGFVRAWTSWLPGGALLSTVLGCAFFTAITGASGVTILALGSLMLPILLAAKHDEKFSLGLLTASGSVGLLFPPSLPVILYGVYAHVPIDQLFIAALLPGILLIAILSAFSIHRGRAASEQAKQPFDWRTALSATSAAKGYLFLPVVVVVGLFGGIMTLVETAALTALWAILLESVFERNLSFRSTLPRAVVEAAVLVGALLAIMGVALGLVSYMVDAEIPQRAAQWVTGAIQSKLLFLLILNGMLLLVGALMDIFSAIVIVVPLIAPIGLAFGIDPVHLGVIFLANLELGYLTPPVGMNLFISSLTFKRPLVQIWRTVLPFLVIFAAWVLLITYAPALTVGVAQFFAR